MKFAAACLLALFVLVLFIEPARTQTTPEKKAFEAERIPGGRLIAAKLELAGNAVNTQQRHRPTKIHEEPNIMP